jgi:hypothetical protein
MIPFMEEAFPIDPAEEKLSEAVPVLISTRRRAIAALCLAGYFAARTYWSLSRSHRPELSGWIFPFNSIWPNWVDALLNLWIYGWFIWLLVLALTRLKQEERVFCAVWIAEVLVPPIKTLVPKVVVSSISWAQLFGNIVMVVSAVLIYRSLRPDGIAEPDDNLSEPRPTSKSIS